MKHTRRQLFSMVAAAFAAKKLPTTVRPKMTSFCCKAHPYVSYDLVNADVSTGQLTSYPRWSYKTVDCSSEIVS
jgi:hypothetical protein